jgi:hypothetical protein
LVVAKIIIITYLEKLKILLSEIYRILSKNIIHEVNHAGKPRRPKSRFVRKKYRSHRRGIIEKNQKQATIVNMVSYYGKDYCSSFTTETDSKPKPAELYANTIRSDDNDT